MRQVRRRQIVLNVANRSQDNVEVVEQPFGGRRHRLPALCVLGQSGVDDQRCECEHRDREHLMDASEALARATIAAALIARGAVEVPAMPSRGERLPDAAGVRLRELTDYVYRLITTSDPPEAL